MPFNVPKQFAMIIALVLGIFFGMQGQMAAAVLSPAGVGFVAFLFALLLLALVTRS